MIAFVRFCYYVSVLFILFWLFFGYYQFPEFVPVAYSQNLGMSQYYSKDVLFYAGSGVFLLINILGMILRNQVKNIPFSVLPVPNKNYWLQDVEHRDALIEVIWVWLFSLTLLINLLIGFVFMALFLVVVTEYGTLYDYRFGIYIPVICISLWWVVLWVRLSVKIARID